MVNLHQTRCINHTDREAVARCPLCRNYFCRECVTEHEGRLVCASCLQKAQPEERVEKGSWLRHAFSHAGGLIKAATSLLLLWIVFYAIGQLLLLIPDSFHSGEIWRGV